MHSSGSMSVLVPTFSPDDGGSTVVVYTTVVVSSRHCLLVRTINTQGNDNVMTLNGSKTVRKHLRPLYPNQRRR